MAWKVGPEWRRQTAFIVAGGTSVASQNLTLLDGRRVIAVNSSYEVVPNADIMFFGDRRWWNEHRNRASFIEFKGRRVTCSNANMVAPNVLRLRRFVPNTDAKKGILGPGIIMARDAVVCNRTSLQGAINLAVHLRAARIVLLGADMGRGPDGRSHHHKPHKWHCKPGNVTWDVQMEQLALAVEPLAKLEIPVINTSPISRLPFWPFMPLEEAALLGIQE